MKKYLLTVTLGLAVFPASATTYSAQHLSANDALRWGVSIVVSQNSSISADYLVAINPENFSRCRVSYVVIHTRDRNGITVQTFYPYRFGAGYYFNLKESLIKSLASELICEAIRVDRPGERYIIDLSGYAQAI